MRKRPIARLVFSAPFASRTRAGARSSSSRRWRGIAPRRCRPVWADRFAGSGFGSGLIAVPASPRGRPASAWDRARVRASPTTPGAGLPARSSVSLRFFCTLPERSRARFERLSTSSAKEVSRPGRSCRAQEPSAFLRADEQVGGVRVPVGLADLVRAVDDAGRAPATRGSTGRGRCPVCPYRPDRRGRRRGGPRRARSRGRGRPACSPEGAGASAGFFRGRAGRRLGRVVEWVVRVGARLRGFVFFAGGFAGSGFGTSAFRVSCSSRRPIAVASPISPAQVIDGLPSAPGPGPW